MDICWQVLVEDNMCANPLAGHRTTYTECCCLYGVAWSEQCAFCPRKDSGESSDTLTAATGPQPQTHIHRPTDTNCFGTFGSYFSALIPFLP